LQRKTINAINFDAHSDFRILEGRHSGNGFSYAYEEGFLKNIVFGLHENYTSKSVLDIIKKQKIACDTPPMTVLKFVKKRF
jgi:formiminoglutamase